MESSPATSTTTASQRDWTTKEIRDLVQAKFRKRPCWFQVKIARALREGKDVVGVAATGAGKTLSFWISLLMALEEGQDKMVVIVTPLNLLGKQTESQLNSAGLSCIAVSKENNNPSTYKAIAAGQYRVVTISPELLNEDPCRNVIENPKVASKFLYFVFDEGHCVSQWGNTFRNEYLYVSNLRYLIPTPVPFYVASATLPPPILAEVTSILRLRPENLERVICSNDRPNIHLLVRPMEHAISSYRDLAFLIPDNFTTSSPRFPKFLAFFDSTTNAEDAIRYLRTRLPPELHDKIKWFHSTMTPEYREEEFRRFADDDVWGLVVTDAFGMGLDLPDVQIVVQYRCPSDLNTLWQRFGRGGRAAGSEATAVLLVEKNLFDAEREKKFITTNKRKAKRQAITSKGTPAKRPSIPTPAPPLTTENDPVTESSESDSDGPDHANLPIDEPLSVTELTALRTRSNDARRCQYHANIKLTHATSKQRTLELGSALDDLINAPTRGLKCRRIVPNLYFTNDKILFPFHNICDDTTPAGCSRCAPKITRLCCDLCNPDTFDNVAPVVLPKAARKLKKSHFKPYEATTADRQLRQRLLTWRAEHAPIALGDSTVDEWGPYLFMSDETLERIVDGFHYNKLPHLEAIQRETAWRSKWVKEFGPGILELLQSCTTSKPVSTSTPRRPTTCSKCRGTGHNSKSKHCPQNIAELVATSFTNVGNKENVPSPLRIRIPPLRSRTIYGKPS